MLIGIHSVAAFKEKRTGVEEYAFQLIKNLAEIQRASGQGAAFFVLYADKISPELTAVLNGCRNFKIKTMRFPFLWTQIRLSLEMLLNPPDILFIPAHVLPLIHPKNSVVMVHGLEYERFPELVTEARNIILFPKKPSVEKALEDGVAEFWPSPDGSKIIYLAESNPQRPPTGGDGEKTSVYFNLKISDLKTGSEIFLNQTGKLCQNNIQNAEQNCRMIWNGAGDKILVSQKTPERWELLEINWSEKKAAISPFFQKPYKAKGQAAGFLPIINPIFNPKNGNEIIYLDGGLLYSINIESGLAAKLTLGDEIIAFTASGNSIFYFLASERSEKPSVSHFQANDKNKNSDFYFSEKSEDLTLKHPEIYLFQTSKDGKQQIKLGSIPAELKIKDRFVSPEILISENNEIAVLVPQNSGQTLYYLKSEIGEFAEIAENADGASFSPDEKKLLYFNKNEIGVYYLEEVLIQPYKKAGDKSELTRLNEKIENALWYSDSEHIIFWADKKVKISELDDRNGINIVDFLDAENPRIFYDFRSENLYFTNGGILSKTKF